MSAPSAAESLFFTISSDLCGRPYEEKLFVLHKLIVKNLDISEKFNKILAFLYMMWYT